MDLTARKLMANTQQLKAVSGPLDIFISSLYFVDRVVSLTLCPYLHTFRRTCGKFHYLDCRKMFPNRFGLKRQCKLL